MWAAQFPDREPTHYLFPFEKCGARGEEDTFGFTAGVIFYGTEPTRPIGDWKEAWEKAKERAAAILKGNKVETRETQPTLEYDPATKRSFKKKSIERCLIPQHFRSQEFERYSAAKSEVLRLIDHAHPAAAELAGDAVVRDGLIQHQEVGSSY